MAFEQLDRGSIKVVASVNTDTGDVSAQGVESAAPVRRGQMRLAVREHMGANEFVFWGSRVDERGGSVRVVRVNDSTFDVFTLDGGGNIEGGLATVFIARITPLGLIAAGAPPAGPTQYVVNSDTGDDSGPGTVADPLASLDEAARRATVSGAITQVTEILLQPAAAGYALTAPIPAAQLINSLFIRVDESQAGAFTVHDTQAAGAGTDANDIVGAGFLFNEHEGRFVRFLDGAAVGQRRQIRGNTTTRLQCVHGFSPAPASGDTFEIFAPAVSVDVSGFGRSDQISALQGPEGIPGSANVATPALVWAWLALSGGNLASGPHGMALYGITLDGCAVHQGPLGCLLSGCDSDAGQFGVFSHLPQLLGVGAQGWFGCGHTCLTTPLFALSWILELGRWAGYCVTRALTMYGCDFRMFGGQITSDEDRPAVVANGTQYPSQIRALPGDLDCRIDYTFGAAANNEAIAMGDNGYLLLGRSDVIQGNARIESNGVGIRLTEGSRLVLNGPTVTSFLGGNDAFIVRHGSRVSIVGAPAYGDGAAADYSIGDGSPQNKSFFAAAGDVMCWVDSAAAGADASAIERVA